MRNSLIGNLILLAGMLLTSKAAVADSICVSYWPWGACALWENTSTLSSGSSSSSGDQDRIYFKNTCSRKIQTAIRVKELSGNWSTNGWWSLNPGETAHVANTRNAIFYVHAQSIDHEVNRLMWEGDDYHGSVRGGRVVGFRQVRSNPNEYVDYTYSFSCDGIYRYKAIALAWNGYGAWQMRVRNTLDQAERAALADCNNCQLSSTTIDPRWPGCLALAKAPGTSRLYANKGTNESEARRNALLNCGREYPGCIIEHISCND